MLNTSKISTQYTQKIQASQISFSVFSQLLLSAFLVFGASVSAKTDDQSHNQKETLAAESRQGIDFFLSDVLEAAAKNPEYERYGFQYALLATERFISDDVRLEYDQKSLTQILYRDSVVNEIMDVIANRGAPLLVGEEGVGKESIVERLAQMIESGQVPNRNVFTNLKHADILLTSPEQIGMITSKAGPSVMVYLNLLVNVQTVLKRDIIVYIENAHHFDPLSLASLAEYIKNPLHPVSVILSAPPAAISNLSKRAPSLLNVVSQFGVEDLKPDQVKELFNMRWAGYLEAKYTVKISDKAISLAIRFAQKTYPQKSLFDGSMQLLSDAAVLLNHQNSDKIGALNLNDKAVMDYLQQKIGLEVNPLDSKSFLKYEKDLKSYLSSKVIGQEGMVNSVVDMWMDLQDPSSKRGVRVVTLMGSTSVGKSLLAREFSQRVFKHDKARLEVACSEYTNKNALDALLGMPTGYMGTDQTSGILNDWLDDPKRGKNGGILIFNEVEKAAPELMNVLMEILDTGRILGKDGKERFLNRHVIMFTTNHGANILYPKGYEKWSRQELEKHLSSVTQEKLKSLFMQKTSGKDNYRLPPEILARIDQFALAYPITMDVAQKILRQKADLFSENAMERYNLKIYIEDGYLHNLVQTSFNQAEGVRSLEKKLELQLRKIVNQVKAEKNPKPGTEIRINLILKEGQSFLKVSNHKWKMEIPVESEPVSEHKLDDPLFIERMKNLDSKMKSMIVGQDQVIETIKNAIVGFYGRGKSDRPLSFFLVGSTGTGKTEMGRALAYALYNDVQRVEVINFGNVMGKPDLNAKFGSQPGYVGFEEIREFEQALMRNPNGGVIVFDELSNMGGSSKEEKNALFKQLYEIFEEGRWHSTQTNTTYDLSKYVIVCTGNDSEKLFQGTGADDLRLATWKEEGKPEKVFTLLRDAGVPEAFLGRMAGLFMMKPLLKDESSMIAEKLLNQAFKKMTEELGIEIIYDQKFLEQFTKTFFAQNQGGRSLRNVIENRVMGLAAMLVVNEGGLKAVQGKKIKLQMTDNLTQRPFVIKPPPKRSVQIQASLIDNKNKVLSARTEELSYDAPEVLKMGLRQALNTAYHEAGHAIVNNPELTGQKVKFITINGQGNYLGYARYENLSEGMFRGDMTEEVMLSWLARLYAGRRAEILSGFSETTGWKSDREKANEILTKYLIDSGMHSDLAGMRFVDGKFDPTPQQKKIIDAEFKKYTERAIKIADETLVQNWHVVRTIVSQIIKTGVMREEDFDRILKTVERPSGYTWTKASDSDLVVRVFNPKGKIKVPRIKVPSTKIPSPRICRPLFGF